MNKYNPAKVNLLERKNKMGSSTSVYQGMSTEFDCYLDSHHDKYLYEMLHKYEVALVGSTNLTSALKDE